jgi:hypothetical protein
MYGLMAVLIIFGFRNIARKETQIKIFIGLVVLGIIIEFLQEYVAINRFLSLWDMFFNSIGASVIFLRTYLIE